MSNALVNEDEDKKLTAEQKKKASKNAGNNAVAKKLADSDGVVDPGSLLSTYGAASGSGLALGGGLALSTVAAGLRNRKKRKEAAEKRRYDFEVASSLNKVQNEQNAIDRMVNMSQGLRNL